MLSKNTIPRLLGRLSYHSDQEMCYDKRFLHRRHNKIETNIKEITTPIKKVSILNFGTVTAS